LKLNITAHSIALSLADNLIALGLSSWLAWMPMLLIENAQQSRQTGAAVESFRNEMVKQNSQSHELLERMNNTALIDMSEVKQ
jgi:ribosomal silencing factor RsfS